MKIDFKAQSVAVNQRLSARSDATPPRDTCPEVFLVVTRGGEDTRTMYGRGQEWR